MASSWLFGIDGGGTNSRLRIESLEGEKLFYGEGGSTNIYSNSHKDVEAALTGLFSKAYAEAGLESEGCVAGFAGSAGVDSEADEETFGAILRKAARLACPIGVGNDSEPALVGAIGDTEGLLLISGTGSIAYGRSRDGSDARAGGWGHLLGDEGSAFRLGFDALARGLRSWEGRDLPTGLLDAGLAYFSLAEPSDLVPFVHSRFDKKRIAGFARVVGEYRDRGDALAVDLFAAAARDLEALVLSVERRIGPKLERERLAFRGGLIEGDAILRAALTARLAASAPCVEVLSAVAGAADAATGACILARSLLKK